MIRLFSCLLLISSVAFGQGQDAKEKIDETLNAWHRAAAEANFEEYFQLMAEDAIFIGTDATENWELEAFKEFSKPYFDRGKAWSFSAVERNIFLSDTKKIGWFDELLKTQMGLCRGSGVMVLTPEGWKIKHYVLSIAIPNDNVSEITKMKMTFDQNLIKKLEQGN